MSRTRAESAVGGRNGPDGRRLARRSLGLLTAVLLASIPSAIGAAPDRSPAISLAIDVATSDCRTVTIDYEIDWQGLTADMAATMPVELHAVPGGYFLTNVALDLGKKDGHRKGKIRGELSRESGYFDTQTYPNSSYQVVIYGTASVDGAVSNLVSIPACVPMTPVSGPAAGGTVVTIFGGGTFGGPAFSAATTVVVDGTIAVSPQLVAADGTWLTFVTPAGTAGTCVSVWTDPGLPFSLPSFCYGA